MKIDIVKVADEVKEEIEKFYFRNGIPDKSEFWIRNEGLISTTIIKTIEAIEKGGE